METQYRNRELDAKFDALDAKQEERHINISQRMDVFESDTSTSLEEIKTLQRYTNGRVRWVEKMIYLAVGGLGILAIIVLPLLWALIGSGRI